MLRKSTIAIESLRVKETKLLQQGKKEEARYGVTKASTTKLLQNVRTEMSRQRLEAGLV